VNVDAVKPRHETLRSELLKLPGVVNGVIRAWCRSNKATAPQRWARSQATRRRPSHELRQHRHRFLATYDIPLLEGRNVSDEVADDTWKEDVLTTNVILNELA
jgi:hypothetical protein